MHQRVKRRAVHLPEERAKRGGQRGVLRRDIQLGHACSQDSTRRCQPAAAASGADGAVTAAAAAAGAAAGCGHSCCW